MWKSTFYRKVDSDVESADGKFLRDIEEKIFRHQKAIIGQELKQKWKGSDYQNQYTNIKISDIVRKVLSEA